MYHVFVQVLKVAFVLVKAVGLHPQVHLETQDLWDPLVVWVLLGHKDIQA